MPDEEVVDQPEVPENPPEEIEQPPVEPVPPQEPDPEPPAPKQKQKFVVQPTDDQGNPIPDIPASVYYYDSPEDLQQQLARSVSHGSRRIHDLRRKMVEEPKAPAGAKLYEPMPDYKPRPLTEEEIFEIRTNPEKAYEISFKANHGMTPAEKSAQDRKMAEDAAENRALNEVLLFRAKFPDYYLCDHNYRAMTKYLNDRNLAYVSDNYATAFKELRADGMLVEKPQEIEPEVTAPVLSAQPAPAEIRTEAPLKPKGQEFPTSLRNNSSRATGPVATKKGPSAAELEMMSADELKKLYPELQHAR